MIRARRIAGSWCDVAPDVLVRVVDHTVRVEGDLVWTAPEPEPPSLYLRCARRGDDVAVIVQGQSGTAWLTVTGAPWQPCGASFGQNAVLVWAHLNRLWVAVMRSPTAYETWTLDAPSVRQLVTIPATSQGLLGVRDGVPILTDAARQGPHGLLLPATAGAVTVAQHPTREALMGVWDDQVFTVAEGAAFEPHLVEDAPDRWRACARSTGDTCLVAELAPPFAADPVPPPIPPVPEPPMPTPYADFRWDACTIHRDAPDLGAWPITSTLTRVATIGDTVVVDHTQAGRWPIVPYEGIVVEGCVWTVAWIDGQWRAATWDRLRPGQTEKTMGADEYQQGYALDTPGWWVPQPGEVVGYLVSTPARGDERGPVNERSGVAWVRYGTDQVVGREDAEGPPATPPSPDPPPADDALAALEIRVRVLERSLRNVRAALGDV